MTQRATHRVPIHRSIMHSCSVVAIRAIDDVGHVQHFAVLRSAEQQFDVSVPPCLGGHH